MFSQSQDKTHGVPVGDFIRESRVPLHGAIRGTEFGDLNEIGQLRKMIEVSSASATH